MSAPLGNNFWEARSKHGREKIFKDSAAMLEAAYEYFEWNHTQHLWSIKEPIKSGDLAGTCMNVDTVVPLTLEGLTQYWGVNRKYLDDFEKSLPEGEKDFSLVITHIREVIWRQKFEGAAVGVFNSNIISMELGLKQKTELSTPPDEKFDVTLNIK